MLFYSMGITQHVTGIDNVRSCANLVMLTAHIGQPMTGLNPLRGQNNVQGACDMGALPDVYSGYQKVSDPAARKKFERAWARKLPEKPGLALTEMLGQNEECRVKAMYIMGENPVISDPDSSHIISAIKGLDFLVVQDIFMSDTAELADVVLPAVTFAEKDGTFTNTERRVQKLREVIAPMHSALPDWKIIAGLSTRMGYDMGYRASHEIMEEIALLTPSYGGILHHRLENFGLQWPCPDSEHRARLLCTGKSLPRDWGHSTPSTLFRRMRVRMKNILSYSQQAGCIFIIIQARCAGGLQPLNGKSLNVLLRSIPRTPRGSGSRPETACGSCQDGER